MLEGLPSNRQELAKSHIFLGTLLQGTARPKEAEAAYRDALAIQEQLAAEFPAVPDYRGELAISHYNLGTLLQNIRRLEEAEAAFRNALPLYKQLAADFPSIPEYHHTLAGTMVSVGVLYLAVRNLEEFRGRNVGIRSSGCHHQSQYEAAGSGGRP